MTDNNKIKNVAALSADNADNVSYQYSTNGVVRTVGARLRDFPTVADFSAAKTACLNAIGKPLVLPTGVSLEFSVYGTDADFASINAAFAAMDLWTIPEGTTVTLRVQKGSWVECQRTSIGGDFRNVNIMGVGALTMNITTTYDVEHVTYVWDKQYDQGTDWVDGQVFHYHKVTYTCSSTTGIEVGNFLIIRSGGNDRNPELYMHYGAWEVIEVDHDNNRVTVFNSCHEVKLPTTFTSNNVRIIRSVILCGSGTSSTEGNDFLELRSGSQLGSINYIAIVGRGLPWNDGNRGPHGYASPTNYYGLILRHGCKAAFSDYASLSGFSNDNILIEGGYLDFGGNVSNAWGHNIVTRAAGVLYARTGISAGGWLDGVTTQDGGITTGSLIVTGNNRIGLNHAQGSSSSSLTVKAIGNGYNTSGLAFGGISLIADGTLCGGTFISNDNIGSGIRLNRNAQLEVNTLTVKNNAAEGVQAFYGSSAFVGTMTASGNGTLLAEANRWELKATNNSRILMTNFQNATTLKTNPILNTVGRDWGFIGTTCADIGFATSLPTNQTRNVIINSKGQLMVGTTTEYPITGSETSISAHIAGAVATGPLVPNTDNTWRLGTGNFRWKEIWCANGTIYTSDARDKMDLKACPLGLDFIRQSQPTAYRWKNGEDDQVYLGFIAQNIQKLVDDSGEENLAIVTTDEDGERLGLRYHELIPILAKAIIDLDKEIEALKALLPQKV